MIGSLIGAGIGAVGSIFGGLSASAAMRRAKQSVERRKAANRAWYDRNYNEDVTQRADAQRVLNETDRRMRERSREAAGVQAVTGGTEESVAAQKAADAQAVADAASRIAAQGEARRDDVERRYKATDEGLSEELEQIERNKAAAVSGAIGGVAQAGAGIADALSSPAGGVKDVEKKVTV